MSLWDRQTIQVLWTWILRQLAQSDDHCLLSIPPPLLERLTRKFAEKCEVTCRDIDAVYLIDLVVELNLDPPPTKAGLAWLLGAVRWLTPKVVRAFASFSAQSISELNQRVEFEAQESLALYPYPLRDVVLTVLTTTKKCQVVTKKCQAPRRTCLPPVKSDYLALCDDHWTVPPFDVPSPPEPPARATTFRILLYCPPDVTPASSTPKPVPARPVIEEISLEAVVERARRGLSHDDACGAVLNALFAPEGSLAPFRGVLQTLVAQEGAATVTRLFNGGLCVLPERIFLPYCLEVASIDAKMVAEHLPDSHVAFVARNVPPGHFQELLITRLLRNEPTTYLELADCLRAWVLFGKDHDEMRCRPWSYLWLLWIPSGDRLLPSCQELLLEFVGRHSLVEAYRANKPRCGMPDHQIGFCCHIEDITKREVSREQLQWLLRHTTDLQWSLVLDMLMEPESIDATASLIFQAATSALPGTQEVEIVTRLSETSQEVLRQHRQHWVAITPKALRSLEALWRQTLACFAPETPCDEWWFGVGRPHVAATAAALIDIETQAHQMQNVCCP
ncbi:MAG: uncharacterized protein KVP18_004292 [Porospora cf. gigantea A]|uniref:uncharacterized protein n=1 Tax=Porospora cf. gigantea A TaxID=2853593 RepID=UPI00355A77CC|nr:MAG: hypothetical protein KVP18_004292 [Porospora cf. gigantea A]